MDDAKQLLIATAATVVGTVVANAIGDWWKSRRKAGKHLRRD